MIGLIFTFLRDGFFAAIASIGFASISRPENKVYIACAFTAAAGHMTRYILMTQFGYQITLGTLCGAIVIGLVSLPFSKLIKTPSECISFPSLLPMVPGMYAYRSIQALVQCLMQAKEPAFIHYLYLLKFNWITCVITIVAMVVGATLPMFLFQKFSFKVTK